MAIPTNRSLVARPAKDEWGVYDPQQAGLAALFARLDTKDTKTAPAAKAAEKLAAMPFRPAPRDGK